MSETTTAILTCIAPCTVFVSGRHFQVDAGERLTITPDEANSIMGGAYKERFIHNGEVRTPSSPKPLALQVAETYTYGGMALQAEGVAEQLFNNSIAPTPDNYTPPPPGPVPDDRAEREAAEAASDFMGKLTPKYTTEKLPPSGITPAFTAVSPESQTGNAAGSASITVNESISIPLEPDAHWSIVRQFILDKETANDVHLKQYAQVIIDRYPTYNSVLQECRRILGTPEA